MLQKAASKFVEYGILYCTPNNYMQWISRKDAMVQKAASKLVEYGILYCTPNNYVQWISRKDAMVQKAASKFVEYGVLTHNQGLPVLIYLKIILKHVREKYNILIFGVLQRADPR